MHLCQPPLPPPKKKKSTKQWVPSTGIKVAFDWEIWISDFAIEHEIRKQISPQRNPSTGWISIKKFKSGLHGFPFYHSIGKSEKKICKTVLVNSGLFFLLIMRARARPLFLRTVFQILFRISQSNGKNENPKPDISALKSVFEFRVNFEHK